MANDNKDKKVTGKVMRVLGPLRTATVFFVVSAILKAVMYLMRTSETGWPELVGNVHKAYVLFFTVGVVFLLRWLVVYAPFKVFGKYTIAPMLKTLINFLIFFGGFMYLLHRLAGVNMFSLFTTSAVLTGIVAFSLQDTIKNFFTGLWINTERIVARGDWKNMTHSSSGKAVIGQVMEMTWRTTRLLTRENEYVFLPNRVMADGILINYTCPTPHIIIQIDVGASYKDPPNKVKSVLLDVISSVPDVSKRTPPEVWVTDFDDYAVNYTMRIWIDDFKVAAPVQNEIRTKLWYAFRRHSIEIPFPIRTIYQREEHKPFAEDYIMMALGSIDFLKFLDQDELKAVGDSASVEVFGADEIIIKEGDKGDTCYFLDSGHVEVQHLNVAGYSRVVATLGPGDFFGEMSLFTGEPRRATVVAKKDTTCIVINSRVFERIFKENPDMAERLSMVLAKRIGELEKSETATVRKRPPEEIKENVLEKIKSFFKL